MTGQMAGTDDAGSSRTGSPTMDDIAPSPDVSVPPIVTPVT